MSYRNPKIIDDKSGLIVSQAINQATATIGQGIVAFGAEEKRREETRKKEQEKRDQIFINLANDMAKNSDLFNANISKASAGLRNVLIPRNEKLLQKINDIQIQQRINGNKDPELSKELSNLRTQVADGNAMAQTYIGVASNLSTDMKDPGAFLRGEKTFRNGADDTSDESAFIYFATGGRPGYTTTWDGDLNVTVSDGKKTYTNTREEFEAKSKNLYIISKGNMRQDENETINKEMYNKTGDLRTDLKVGEAKIGDEIKAGRLYTYSNQPLNTAEVERIITLNAENIGSKLGSLDGDKQAQAIRLRELNIDTDEYQNGTAEKKIELIKQFAETNFLDTKGVEYNKEEGSYSLVGQIGNSTKVNVTESSLTEKDRNAKINVINKSWNNLTKDVDFSTLSAKQRAQYIVNSLPVLGGFGFNEDGNIVIPSNEIDKAAMLTIPEFIENEDTGATDVPNPAFAKKIMKPGKIINIADGNSIERINVLTPLLAETFGLNYQQAEDQARIFLKN